MPIDVGRYGYLVQEFRYLQQYDEDLDTKYKRARELDIPTNLSMANIETLIIDMFGVIGSVRRRFEVIVAGTDYISINDFSGSVPARLFTAPEFGVEDLPVIITAAVIKESEDVTELELWG